MKERILKNIAEIQVSGKSTIELYNEISSAVMREISFTAPATDKKSAYYLSIEFLIGRMFYNNLLELDILHETEEILKAKGADISLFEMIEDAALGNGGLAVDSGGVIHWVEGAEFAQLPGVADSLSDGRAVEFEDIDVYTVS